jgi:hypothetical protein
MAKISHEDLEKIQKIEGEVIGASLQEDAQFIRQKEGEEGLKKLETEMAKLGYPLKLEEIKSFQWYPLSLNLLCLVVARNIFDWPDDTFRENGRFSAKVSLIAKVMMKYFISLRRCLAEAGNYWRKYYTVGELKAEGINEKEKLAFLVLRDFTGHPLLCRILEGYFWQVISYVVPKEKLIVQEIECVLKGGKAHRFKITW